MVFERNCSSQFHAKANAVDHKQWWASYFVKVLGYLAKEVTLLQLQVTGLKKQLVTHLKLQLLYVNKTLQL